jgi:hypothetical protein
VSSSDVSV